MKIAVWRRLRPRGIFYLWLRTEEPSVGRFTTLMSNASALISRAARSIIFGQKVGHSVADALRGCTQEHVVHMGPCCTLGTFTGVCVEENLMCVCQPGGAGVKSAKSVNFKAPFCQRKAAFVATGTSETPNKSRYICSQRVYYVGVAVNTVTELWVQ